MTLSGAYTIGIALRHLDGRKTFNGERVSVNRARYEVAFASPACPPATWLGRGGLYMLVNPEAPPFEHVCFVQPGKLAEAVERAEMPIWRVRKLEAA